MLSLINPKSYNFEIPIIVVICPMIKPVFRLIMGFSVAQLFKVHLLHNQAGRSSSCRRWISLVTMSQQLNFVDKNMFDISLNI